MMKVGMRGSGDEGGAVDEPEDDAGGGEGFVGALYAEGFDGVGGVAQAGGVNKAEGYAFEFDIFFDGVASSSVDVTYDGSVVAGEGIKEC